MTLAELASILSASAAVLGVISVAIKSQKDYGKTQREFGRRQGAEEEREKYVNKEFLEIRKDLNKGLASIRDYHDAIHLDHDNNIKWLDKNSQVSQCEKAQTHIIELLRQEIAPIRELLSNYKEIPERVAKLEAKVNGK
jgi:uncharacterized membrane protein